MSLDLHRELRLSAPPDVETETTYFYQHAPHVGSHAYLHIIFKARPELLPVVDHLELPALWSEFLSIQNGAHLFSNSLDIYGLTSPGQLMNRRGFLSSSPWCIAEYNKKATRTDPLQIGVYCHDRSLVLLDRSDGTVRVTSGKGSNVLATWPSIQNFLTDELARLKALFSPDGRPLTESSFTLPNTRPIQ